MQPLRDITTRPLGNTTSGRASAHLNVGFDLLNSRNRTRLPTNSEEQSLWDLFPRTNKVDIGPIGVTIHVNRLPPRPLPISVANVPLFITDDPEGLGYFELMATDGRITLQGGPSALHDLRIAGCLDLPAHALSEILHYCNERHIPRRAIASFFGDMLLCTLSEEHTAELPRSFGGRTCFWKVYDREEWQSLGDVQITSHQTRRARAAPHRNVDPSPTVIDDTSYLSNLRPGIMVRSDY